MATSSLDARRQAAVSMVRRVVDQFTDPELEVPSRDEDLDALIDELEGLGDVRDSFRRTRAATAVRHLRRGEFEEAVYEALHADAARMADSIAAARGSLLR